MRRLVFAALLALMLTSWGCVGYHRGYSSSYSPGCYSCGRSREYDSEHHSDRRGHRGGGHGGGGHHRDHDRDRDDDHHRRH